MGGNAGMGGGGMGSSGVAGGFVPPPSGYLNASSRIDQAGDYEMGGMNSYIPFPPQLQGQSPRQLRTKRAGGAQAPTSSASANQVSKYSASAVDADAEDGGGALSAGPPFRSQAERRQWLLNEKRRWLVEMRLGNVAVDQPAKLPPISPGGGFLSNGMQVDALVSPR